MDHAIMTKQQPAAADKTMTAMSQAQILSEALPFMQRYDNKTVVVKYGGNAMGDDELAAGFARDIVLLKQAGVNPIVVHGGGPQIGAMLERLKIESEFKDGLRVTDRATVEIVQMVLAGSINKEIVTNINVHGGKACGISGKDANLMIAKKLEKMSHDPKSNTTKLVDLGFVGEPVTMNPHIVEVMVQSDLIPVIAPIAAGVNGETFNINADTFAGHLAAAMNAKRLLLLTDVKGVLDKEGALIEKLTLDEARALIDNGTISGGMIPKIESSMAVVEDGVEGVVIVDGRVKHAVLLELFTEHGIGTLLGEKV
jgi:acetylglutamate kinase